MPAPAVLVKPQVTVLLALLVMVTLPVTASQAPVAPSGQEVVLPVPGHDAIVVRPMPCGWLGRC
jgi:hypothetical protein